MPRLNGSEGIFVSSSSSSSSSSSYFFYCFIFFFFFVGGVGDSLESCLWLDSAL